MNVLKGRREKDLGMKAIPGSQAGQHKWHKKRTQSGWHIPYGEWTAIMISVANSPEGSIKALL
jgi:hypothetical protein